MLARLYFADNSDGLLPSFRLKIRAIYHCGPSRVIELL